MGYYLMQVVEANAVVEPFNIAEDALAPTGIDEYAWNDFRGAHIDEKGYVHLKDYLGTFDIDAGDAFALMLSYHIKSGRVVLAFEYEGESSHGYVIEKGGVVRFGVDQLHPQEYFGENGRDLMDKVISEAVAVYKTCIDELMGMKKSLYLDKAA